MIHHRLRAVTILSKTGGAIYFLMRLSPPQQKKLAVSKGVYIQVNIIIKNIREWTPFGLYGKLSNAIHGFCRPQKSIDNMINFVPVTLDVPCNIAVQYLDTVCSGYPTVF